MNDPGKIAEMHRNLDNVFQLFQVSITSTYCHHLLTILKIHSMLSNELDLSLILSKVQALNITEELEPVKNKLVDIGE